MGKAFQLQRVCKALWMPDGRGIQASKRRKHPNTPLWWRSPTLGPNLLHGRPSASVWQSRINKSCFDSQARRTNSSSIWHYSWTGRSLRNPMPFAQKQTGKTDCGCFAIARAVHLASGDKPETITLDQKQLHSHLETCLLQNSSYRSHTILKGPNAHTHKHLLFWTSLTMEFQSLYYGYYSTITTVKLHVPF